MACDDEVEATGPASCLGRVRGFELGLLSVLEARGVLWPLGLEWRVTEEERVPGSET